MEIIKGVPNYGQIDCFGIKSSKFVMSFSEVKDYFADSLKHLGYHNSCIFGGFYSHKTQSIVYSG